MQFGAQRRAVLRLQRVQRRGPLRLRRAVPVLAVLLRHRGLGVGVAEGLRRRRLQRPAARSRSRARRRGARAAPARSRCCSSTVGRLRRSPGATSRRRSLPPIEVLALLAGELDKDENWRALLPTAANLLVSLRQLDDAADDARAAPARHAAREPESVPLDLTLDAVGEQRPSRRESLRAERHRRRPGEGRRRVGVVRRRRSSWTSTTPPSSRAPAFERQHGGVDLGHGRRAATSRRTRSRASSATRRSSSTPTWRRLVRRFRGFAGRPVRPLPRAATPRAARCSRSAARTSASRSPTSIKAGAEGYVVATQARQQRGRDGRSQSEATAQDALAADRCRSRREELHVIPASEAVAA